MIGASSQPTRADVDVRFNTLYGDQIDDWFPRSQGLQEWGANFYAGTKWPRTPPVDASGTSVVGTCQDASWISSYPVPLAAEVASSCSSNQLRVAGYSPAVNAALAYAPAPVPPSVSEGLNPQLGPVNTLTGQLTYSTTDLSLLDAGSTVSAVRTYRSDRLEAGDAGAGWFGSYGQKFAAQTLSLGDGGSLSLPQDPNNNGPVPAQGTAAVSSASDRAGSAVGMPDGSTYRFNPAGELVAIASSDPGRTISVTSGGGAVTGVKGVSGRSLSFARSGGRLTSVSDSTGRSVSLT